MLKYIVKRILQMIPMMIILSIVVFCMVRLIPGDPVTMSLGMGAGKEAIAAETARLGLDKPLWQQYFIWVKTCSTVILVLPSRPIKQFCMKSAAAILTQLSWQSAPRSYLLFWAFPLVSWPQ